MIKGSKRVFYGESLKRQVVRDYETGRYTYSSVSEKYGILGGSTVFQFHFIFFSLQQNSNMFFLTHKTGAFNIQVQQDNKSFFSNKVSKGE